MLAGYKKLINADKAVINTRFYRPDGRSGSDAGMIDIFHPERLSANLGNRIQNCLHEKLIQRLLLVSRLNQIKVKCRNLYLNRGFKIHRTITAMVAPWNLNHWLILATSMNLIMIPIAMSRVPSPPTHMMAQCTIQQKEPTRSLWIQPTLGAEAISLLAKASEMVLSSQKVAYCDHPQHPEAKRTTLVNTYQR